MTVFGVKETPMIVFGVKETLMTVFGVKRNLNDSRSRGPLKDPTQ